MVLVGGHESNNGADLSFVKDHIPDTHITAAGRPLHNTLTQLQRSGKGAGAHAAPIVVLPLTFGRNPTLVADTAKTLHWLGAQAADRDGGVPLALADPFGTRDHLTAWLRAAATEVHRRSPQAALLITADAANPFDDAELYRIAHLVRTHGAGIPVETATVEDTGGLLEAVQRLRLLGSTETVVVPAGFQREPYVHGQEVPFGEDSFADTRFYGPLLSEQAVLRVIRERVRDALHALGHGRTGIDAGLQADHGHGYAHSHAFEESNGHSHTHPHGTSGDHMHHSPAPVSSS